MFEFLLYAEIKCTDASDILRRLDAHQHISNEIKAEIIATVKEATPHCTWDAND